MKRRRIEVVCGLIEHEGLVLACQRPPEKHLGGLWEFPGGKVEPNESKEFALVRELDEELQIQISVITALSPVDWSDEHVQIRLYPFRCHIVSGSPRPLEHSEIRWCDASNLSQLEWAEADVPIYQEWLTLHNNRQVSPPHC